MFVDVYSSFKSMNLDIDLYYLYYLYLKKGNSTSYHFKRLCFVRLDTCCLERNYDKDVINGVCSRYIQITLSSVLAVFASTYLIFRCRAIETIRFRTQITQDWRDSLNWLVNWLVVVKRMGASGMDSYDFSR